MKQIKCMTELERFYKCMNYEKVDRHPFFLWGEWPETLERWKKEGYKPDVHNLSEGAETFPWYGSWFLPNPPFEKRVLEENEYTITYINHEGILMREIKSNAQSSMPQFLKFPVETRQDFKEFWENRMQPDMAARLGVDWKSKLKDIRNQPSPFVIWAASWGGFFGPLRSLVGVENLCMLFYDNPTFLEEMMDNVAEFIIAMMSQILDVVNVDVFLYWEDMAYKTAPLISPKLARTYMLPRYKKVNDFLYDRGIKFIGLDSDGYIEELIPVWLDGGINLLFPFEVQCGMDVLSVRKQFGKELRIWGGIDKRSLAEGSTSIDKELERVRPLIEEGGYIPHTDHSIPPDVSFNNYLYYMKKIKEVCTV